MTPFNPLCKCRLQRHGGNKLEEAKIDTLNFKYLVHLRTNVVGESRHFPMKVTIALQWLL